MSNVLLKGSLLTAVALISNNLLDEPLLTAVALMSIKLLQGNIVRQFPL
jgi:hypothetical protein